MTDHTLTPPDVESDDAPVLAGDLYDDDPQVLDSLVQQEAEPPTRKEVADAQIVEPRETLHAPRVTTRMLTQTLTLSSAMPPMQVLPRDPDRLGLTVRVLDDAESTAALLLTDDPSKASQRMGAFVVTKGDSLVGALDNHTGPLVLSVARLDNDPLGEPVSAVVTVVAVTK